MLNRIRELGREVILTGGVETVTRGPVRFDRNHFDTLKDNVAISNAIKIFKAQTINETEARKALMDILVIITCHGTLLKESEVSDIFFASTQLFQSKSWAVRRLVYALLGALPRLEQGSFIITACLMKDLVDENPAFRAKAIRRCSTLEDEELPCQLESHVRNAIMDQRPIISSAAVLFISQLTSRHPELRKRLNQDIMAALHKLPTLPQGLAVKLLSDNRKGDFLGLKKTLCDIEAMACLGKYGEVAFIESCADLIIAIGKGAPSNQFADFKQRLTTSIEQRLNSPRQEVSYQAAKSIIEFTISEVTNRAQIGAVHGLSQSEMGSLSSQMLATFQYALRVTATFLQASSAVTRFAAMRLLNRVSVHSTLSPYLHEHLEAIELCLLEPVPTITVMALSVLLTIGDLSRVDGYMVYVTDLSSGMTERLRVEIVQKISHMALKKEYESKTGMFLATLTKMTREERRSPKFKLEVVAAMVSLSKVSDSNKKAILQELAEFIEDSEFEQLTAFVIGIVAELAVQLNSQNEFIRFIYNRLILEPAYVRAAAVVALRQMSVGTCNESHVESIMRNLVKTDSAGLVRALAAETLQDSRGDDDLLETDKPHRKTKELWATDADLPSAADIERLARYINNFGPEQMATKIDDILAVGVPEEAARLEEVQMASEEGLLPVGGNVPHDRELVAAVEKLQEIIPGRRIGELSHSSAPISLTASAMEYLVQYRALFFSEEPKIVALQLSVNNTLEDVTLKGVTPFVTAASEGCKPLGIIAVDEIGFDETRKTYIILQLEQPLGSYRAEVELRFTMFELGDPTGTEECYPLESITLGLPAQVTRSGLTPMQSANVWRSFDERMKAEGMTGKTAAQASCVFAAQGSNPGQIALLISGATGLELDPSKVIELDSAVTQCIGTLVGSYKDQGLLLAKAMFKPKGPNTWAVKVIAMAAFPDGKSVANALISVINVKFAS